MQRIDRVVQLIFGAIPRGHRAALVVRPEIEIVKDVIPSAIATRGAFLRRRNPDSVDTNRAQLSASSRSRSHSGGPSVGKNQWKYWNITPFNVSAIATIPVHIAE